MSSPKLSGDGTYQLEVSGESKYTKNFEQLFGKRSDDGVNQQAEAMLVCEPANPYDPNAVRVDIGGLPVGYVPRNLATAVGEMIRRHGSDRVLVDAIVRGGWDRGDGDEGTFGVTLDVKLAPPPAASAPKRKRRIPWWGWVLLVLGLLLLCGMIARLGSGPTEEQPQRAAPVIDAPALAVPMWTPTAIVAAPTAVPVVAASRCVPASAGMLLRIRTGVQGVDSNNDIKSAWAVRSNDFSKVWMVAAKIYGPGMEAGTGPGLWAINGELDDPGLTFSVDSFANEFSDWGDGRTTDAAFSIGDDGANEAMACARNN